MSQKVRLLESAILSNNEVVKSFFENSFDYIDNKVLPCAILQDIKGQLLVCVIL